MLPMRRPLQAVVLAFVSLALLVSCGRSQATELEVTYYYLPG
jgi:hypothetical protein